MMQKNEKFLCGLLRVIFENFKNKDLYGAFFAICAFIVFLFFTSLSFNFLKKDTVSAEILYVILFFYIAMIVGLIIIEIIEKKKTTIFYKASFLNIDFLNQYKNVLIDLLNSTREDIFSELADTVVDKDNIRANVFLPQHYGLDGYIYKLVRPEVLKIPKCKPHNDDNIFFQPNEGLTGEVFESGIPKFTKSKDYNLKNRFDFNKDLQWILSWPLKTADGDVLGVINIDCLKIGTIDEKILQKLLESKKILDLIQKISDQLNSFNKTTVALCKKKS